MAAATFVAGCALLSGCGSGSPVGPGNTVDAKALSATISAGLAKRFAIPAPQVTCPPGEKNIKGSTFRCATDIDGQALPINAEVRKDNSVDWQPGSAVIATSKAAEAISAKFTAQLQLPVTATCGSQTLTVVAVGASFTCTASVNDGPRQVTVTAQDLAGNVSFVLAPPDSGPDSTTPPVTSAPTPESKPGPAATLPGT